MMTWILIFVKAKTLKPKFENDAMNKTLGYKFLDFH